MVLQVQLMIVYVALLQLVELYPLNHDGIQQFTTFTIISITSIIIDITINHVGDTIIAIIAQH